MPAAIAPPSLSRPLSAALEVLNPLLAAPDASQAIVAAKCIGLMHGYDARWLDAEFKIDEVECLVLADLYNIETSARSRTFRIGGKLDVRARDYSGRRVIFDHKTTSEDILDPNADYWRQLAIEGQVSHYELLEWQNGLKADYGMWDVVRKPQISPKQLASKKELVEVLATKLYYGLNLDDAQRDAVSETGRETVPMYAARLAEDCTVGRPERYFQRRAVPRMDSEIYDYALELWGHAKDLMMARRSNRHPRNSGACMLYHSPCKFLGICSGHDEPDSDKWTRKANVHVELPTLEGDGRDVLTNSRIRTWQTCRRKHYYEYELGIERLDAEEREAIFFGTMFHQALERWFLTIKHQQETNGV